MKKFMIFLLMAFLYLGTSQASNEFAPSSIDVGKSLHHWVSPSVSSPAYAKFKPFSSFAPVPSGELIDSVIRVRIEGPTHACPGQRVVLTAIIENDFLGIQDTEIVFRRNGNYTPLLGSVTPQHPNRIEFEVPDLGGLDSLIQEYDVVITHGCKTFISPVHYLHIYSIHVQLEDVLVCDTNSNGMMCTQVFSNGAETPYAYVWYNTTTGDVEDTTWVPCKALPVGKYVVEPHFTWNGCVRKSDTAEVKVFYGPANNHITMDSITALACNGNQVNAKLSGIIHADSMGTPSIVWSLNGIVIPGANDSTLIFSPLTIAGDTTSYVLKAEVSYANYVCKTFTVTDTIQIVNDPEISIYGDPVVCGTSLDDQVLIARLNGYISNPVYTWRVDGVQVSYTGLNDSLKLSELSTVLTARAIPYEVTVKVTGGDGCSANSETFLLYVNGLPVVHVGRSADTVCNGTSVTLTANLENNNIPNLAYEWWYKTGSDAYVKDSTATSAQYVTNVIDSTTTYKVFVKQLDSECQSYDSVKVAVFPQAPAVKDLVLMMSDTAVCYGDHVTLTLNDTANTNQYGVEGSYQWLVNGVEEGNVSSKTLSFAPVITDRDSAVYTITVNAIYTTTCEQIPTSIDTTIVLYKKPTVIISGDPIVCHDVNVNLTAHIDGRLDTNNYTWRVDGVDSITNRDFVTKLDERDYPYNITVVVAPGTACEVVSEVYPVIIGNTATAALEASDSIVCKYNNVTLTAHLGDYNMPNLTYLWYKKEGTTGSYDSIAIGTSRILTVPVADTTSYFVKITQVNSGCVAYSDTITVKVYGEPEGVQPLVMFANDSIICNGGELSFAIIDTANINQYGKGTYQWAVNGVTVANAIDSIFNFSPVAFDNDSTLYNIKATVTYTTPCKVITATIDTNVNVFGNPSVVISGDPILCEDSIVHLVATVHDTIVGKPVQYSWRIDGIDTVGMNTKVFETTLPVRDYPYEITVLVNQGAGCVASDVYSVLIGINPTVAIELSDTIVCKGEDVTLTAHLGDYNMPNLVYQWYEKIGNADSVAIPIGTSRILTVPVYEKTRYFVRVQQVNSKCEAWADTVVNVFPPDSAVQPIELLASDSNVCIGGQITFTVQDTTNRINYFGSDSIPGAYRWFVNGFELMTVSGDHFTFSPAIYDIDSTNYVIEVVASYQTECNLWTATAADTITVQRNPSVVINGDPIICDTTNVHLVAIVNDSLVGPDVTYLWRVDGVDSLTKITNVFETSLPARDYPYEITVMLNQGTNCEVVSDPFYLYIDEKPQVVVTVDYDTVCVGQVVNLTAHLGNYNQPNLTYQWYADDTVLVAEGTESTLAYTISNTDFTAFRVVVTQLNSACQGTGRDTVVTAKNPVFDKIVVLNAHDNTSYFIYDHVYNGQPAYDLCEGANVRVVAWLKDEMGNPYIDSNITYKWRRNGVVIDGINGYTFMEQLSILDGDQAKYVYTAEIEEPQYPNCYANPISKSSDTVKVRRNPVVIIGGQRYVCYSPEMIATVGYNVQLHAMVDGVGNSPELIYKWYVDGEQMASLNITDVYSNQGGAIFQHAYSPRYGFDYTFQVEVISGEGCSSWSDPFPVTVMAAPVINITPYSDTVCTGGEVMLVSHLDDYNVTDYELAYQWYANEVTDEGLIPGETSPYYHGYVDTTTNFIVSVRYLTENTDNHTFCAATDTVEVAVYDTPIIDSIIMSLTEACEGSQIALTAVMDSVHQGVPNVPYIYVWYRNSEQLVGNGATIYDNPMTVDGNEQQFTYSVKVFQNPERMYCESPIYVSSQTLTIFPNPIVEVSGDQHICYTDTITLLANIDTISNPVSTNVHYYWFESGHPIDNLNGDSAVLSYYAPAQDEPYRFTVQVEREDADRGCRAYSYEYDVWVYNAPVANVTIVDEKVCEGAEVTVTAHLNLNTPEQTNLEYKWYTKTPSDADFVEVPNATELTYTTIINDTTEFMFKVEHMLSHCIDMDTVIIYTYPVPVVTSVSMSDTNVCEGSDVVITAHIDSLMGIPGLPYFYEWRRNGELLAGNTASIHDQPMTADGTTQTYVYSAIAYQTPDRLACTSDLTNSAELTVFGNPRVAIFGDMHVCYTDTIMLTANVDTFAYPVGDLHYQWYESGAMITNLNGDSKDLKYWAPAQDEPYRFTVQIERDNAQAACRMYSDEYDVYVYNAPEVNLTIVDENVCEGAEVTVTAHLNLNTPEQTNLVYKWYTKTPSDTEFVEVLGATALTYTTIINDTTEFMFKVENSLSHCFDIDTTVIYTHPVPVVNFVSMSDTNVCEGAQVTIYADIDTTMGVAGQPYFFEWRRNGDLLAANTQTIFDSPMTVDGNEQTFVYSVIAYQTPERLACYSAMVESATLNVYPNPRVAISGDQYVCETDSVFLYANVDTIGRPVGTLHYTWYESGRLRDNMAYGLGDSRFFSEYFYAQDEPYRFTVEVQRDNIEGGCRAYSEEFLVWVYKQPVVNITASETDVCVGGEVTLRANLNNYEFNYANDAQYQWYTVDTVRDTIHVGVDANNNYIDSVNVVVEHNPIPGATMLTYTTVMTQSQVFAFTATHNLSGCSDYDEINITVNDIPVIVSVENMIEQDTICPGGRVELHATVSGGVAGGEVYTWYRNGVQLESTGENLIDYPVAVDNNVTMYIYEVAVRQNAAGCASVIDSLSTDTIWVVPNPTIELSGDPIVCDTTNMNIVITANVVSYVDTTDYGYTYQWYENNAPIEGETGLVLSMHKPYRDYPYSFNFAVQNPYGCTVESEPFFVYVNDAPVVHIAADDTVICTNGTVTLTADLYDQNAENLVYQWYNGTDSIPGAYNTTYTTTLATTSTFSFKVFQRDSHCGATSNEVTVNVVAAPVVDSISVESNDVTICEGHVVILKAHISGGDTTNTPVYTWYKDNEVVEGVTGETYTDYPMSIDNEITTHVYNVTVAQASSACFSLYDEYDEVTVTVRPNPRYTIYGDADVCEANAGDNNIKLFGRTTDSLIASTTAYTYNWYEEDTLLGDQTTATLEVNRPYRTEPYIFKLIVTDTEFGCTSETEEFEVYVNARPIVNVTSTEDTICTNGVVTLTANIYDQNAEFLAFTWYKKEAGASDSTIINGANNMTYTTAVATTTEFFVVVDQLTTDCQTVASTTVKVNAIPVVDSITLLSDHDTICAGGRVELQANISGGVEGGEVYTWYRNGEELESTGNTVVDYPSTVDNNYATYVYEVVVRQNAAACQSVITPASTHTILVAPNPTIELAGDAIVCDTTGNNITVNANVVFYVDTTNFGFTYQWYENNVAINGANGLTLSIDKEYRDYPYSFNFAVQNAYGCTVESEPFLVYVNEAPVVHIAADDTVICTNGTVTLTADLYDQNANNLVYQWYNGTDSIPGAYNTTYTTTLATTSTFSFKVFQRDSHCEATSNEVTVKVVAAPVVENISVESNDVTICEGHVVTLKAHISGGDTTNTPVYTWYKDNEVVEGVTGEIYTDYPMSIDNEITTHVYNVTVAQASDACFSLYDENDEVTVTVRPNPRYTIYGDADVCESNEANISLIGITNDEIIGNATDYIYTWYESGVEIAGQNADTLDINKPYRHEPYLFKLVVTDTLFGCTAETAEFAVTVAKKPVAVIVVDQDSICEGGHVTLTSTLMNQTEEGVIYQWQDSVGGAWNDIAGAIAPAYVTPALTANTYYYRLRVNNTYNDCESFSNEVTVTVKSTPQISIVGMSDTTLCNGGEVTLTATSADHYTGLGNIQYQWYENGQAITGANQNVYTTSPLTVEGDMTTYSFGVQVTMSNSGCESNVATGEVTVYADPTVTITYNNGLTLCEGGTTTLTANPHHAYFTDFTYQWFLHGQPIPSANGDTLVVENLAASANAYDYTVEVTVNNGTQIGCSAMAEPVYVTIVNDPTAYITVDENVNAICEGGTVTFTVHVNDGVSDTYNPYTYAWYNNIAGTGVVLGTESSFTTSATDAANLYVYTVDVTSLYGCNVQVTDTLRIVADPTVTIAVKAGEDTVVCDGGHTTLIATVEGGLGTPAYQWYKNGFEIPGANGNELVTDALYAHETAAYTVSVAQSGIACTATSTQFNVSVYEAIEVTLSASNEFNCVGGSVTLTATTTNGIPGDVLTYQWLRNGNLINNANDYQYVTDENLVAGHYEYQVIVSSNISGCHVSQSGTIGITVEAEPTVMISSDVDGNTICEGGDLTLTANVIYATNATQHTNTYTYTWKWYEGTTLRSAQTTEPHYTLPTTLAAGSYNFYVEIESNDGLGCDNSSQSNLFNVVVKPVPSVILTANAAESCQGGDVTFNAVVIPSNLSGIFYWDVNGQQIISDNASITVNNMVVGTNNVSVVFAPNDAQVACSSATTTITHVVNAIPVVTVAATDPARLSMCVGGTITIAATATGATNSSDHYVWNLDNETQNGNTASTFTTQLNTPGIHIISAKVERAMGCNSDFSTPIAVVVAEQPTAQLTQTAGFTEMCAGGAITLMAKVANFSTVNNGVTNSAVHGTYTYTWYRDFAEFTTTPNVSVDNAQISEVLNTPAAYTYSVSIAASGFNCQAADATLDHQIRVVPDPSWSVNQVNPTELCIGGIVTLNAEVTGGVENQQAGRIQWYKIFNGVESEVAGLGGQNTDVPGAAGVYTYAPKYIDYIGAGCNIADATATQVTVNDLPTANFISGHGSVICGHDYQSFATLQIALTGTAPFTFTIMNMTTGESQTIVTSLSVYSYNVNPEVTSIYRIVSVSDANGCIGTMDNVSDAVVSVSDVQIAASSVVVSCDTWMARIPLKINASTATTYSATLPNDSVQYGTIMFDPYTQEHYIEVYMGGFIAGDYRITIEVDGCTGDVEVRVPAGDANMGLTTSLIEQRWDDVVVVNNNPDNNGGYTFSQYQWYRNGEPITGANGQYYKEEGGLEGFYSVELDGVRVENGTTVHVHFVTCEKYFSGKSSIRVYPVPASSTQEITIELDLSDEELNGAILDIYDMKGAHIRSMSNLTPITKVGNFGAQGTYFGRIITGTNEIKTVKFIIVK